MRCIESFFVSGVFRYECLGHFQCGSLLQFDFVLAFICFLSRVSECQTKHVVSLHSSIHTTITWNGFAQFLGLVFLFFVTVKHIHSFFICLFRNGPAISILMHIKESVSVGLELSALDSSITFSRVNTKEIINRCWWDRLLRNFVKIV